MSHHSFKADSNGFTLALQSWSEPFSIRSAHTIAEYLMMQDKFKNLLFCNIAALLIFWFGLAIRDGIRICSVSKPF
jgi:hypothetical protein